jgi:hypothetical protein
MNTASTNDPPDTRTSSSAVPASSATRIGSPYSRTGGNGCRSAQSFHFADLPPKRSGDGPPSPGDASIVTYRVFDVAGAKRLGRAQFVCTAVDRRGEHEQCSGTIALPDGQIATQGDADNVAVTGGSGAYAGARGTATGEDHPDSVDVTVHFVP